MKTATVKLDELKEAKYNPRKRLKNGDETFEKLKNSIKELGFAEPIIVNERNMTVIGGHQRLNALKELGEDSTTVVLLNIDEKQEKELNLALNRIKGYWDYEKLGELLDELKQHEGMLELTGFEEFEIKVMKNSDIDYLMDNSFTDFEEKQSLPKSTFDTSFVIPDEYKEIVTNYVSKHTKKPLANAVIDLIEGRT